MNTSEANPGLVSMLTRLVPARYLSSPDVLTELARRWQEGQRHWHGPGHIMSLLPKAGRVAEGEDRDVLLLAAAYHDAIYDPRAIDNEERSAALLVRHAADPEAPVIRRAYEIILESKWTRLPDTPLGRTFFELDTAQLADGCPTRERLVYERAIFREYQHVPWLTYFAKRQEFLIRWAERFPHQKRGAQECGDLLWSLQPREAVYPGSFAPFHLGHWSVLRRAEQVFDKVVVALGTNRQKPDSAATLAARHEALRRQLPFHETVAFDGLLSEYLDSTDFVGTVVRGVRDGTDLEAELRYARFLEDLRPGTPVVWIGCEPQHQHLSSSALRELAAIQLGAEARYLPTATQIYHLVEDTMT